MLQYDQHLRLLTAAQRADVERIAEEFESAWLDGNRLEIAALLPQPGPLHDSVLLELALIEMELLWKEGKEVLAEDYLRRYPSLARSRQATILVRCEDELRKRHSAGAGNPREQNPSSGEKRFPIRLNCPHCLEPIAVVADGTASDVVCPCCDGTFRLDGDSSETWQPQRLPKLGKFELLALVGRGSFGAVYRARDTELDRIVAVKLPRSGSFSTKEDEDRFVREARSAAQMQHIGIVPVYEVGRSELFPYIVTEFVAGVTLADYISTRRLGIRQSAQLVAEVADALEHAHRQGVVHRDLKPSNIMLEPLDSSIELADAGQTNNGHRLQALGRDGNPFRPRIMDFGLARREDGEDITVAVEGEPLGTPAYMSPEQARGESRSIDGRSDIYSLGVIQYQLLAGELPFRGNARMLVHQVQYDEPIPPRRMNDRLPRDLETICLMAMAKQPRHRYARAADLASDLRRFLAGEPIHARPVGRLERTWRWCMRNPTAAALIGSLLFALIVTCAAAFLSWEQFRGKQLATLERGLDSQLEGPVLSTAYIHDVHRILSEIQAIDARRGREGLGRFDSQYAKFLREQILQPKLERRQLAQIHLVLDAWKEHHGQSERTLRAELQEYEDRETDLFEFNSPLAALPLEVVRDVFPEEVGLRNGQLVRTTAPTGSERWPLVALRVANPRNVELDITFSRDWLDSSVAGLALGCQELPNSPPRYLFVLRTVDNSTPGRMPTFREAKASGGSLLAEIRRGDRRIRSFLLDPARLGDGPLRMWVKRAGNVCRWQLNELPQYEFREIFLTSDVSPGSLGVVWPHAVGVERLAAREFRHIGATSSLARADELLASGAPSQALELYLAHERQQPAGLGRQEAQLRRAICLTELGRHSEAEPLLEELSAATDREIALAARLRLWFLLVKTRQLHSEKADAVFKSLSANYAFSDLAVLLPDDVQEELIRAYTQSVPETGYQAVRPDPRRVENFERLLNVLLLLEAPQEQILRARYWLALSYHHEERHAAAIDTMEALLASFDPKNNESAHCDLLRHYVYLLLRTGQNERALAEVDELLTGPGKTEPLYLPLRIDRARILIANNDHQAAFAEIEKVLSGAEKILAKRPDCYLDAVLVGGFLQEQLSHPDKAQDLWREGVEWIRRHPEINLTLYASLLGSLTNQFTTNDAEHTIKMVVGQTSESPALNFLARGFAPVDLIRSVLRNMWRTPRGKEFARQLAFHQLPYARYGTVQVLLSGYELWRQGVQNSEELEPPISAEEDLLLWQLCEDLFAQYSEGTLLESHVVALALTWDGANNFLGWGLVAPVLKPRCRGSMEYVFGCHYARLRKIKEAREFFAAALEHAEPGSPLERLTHDRLRLLETASAP